MWLQILQMQIAMILSDELENPLWDHRRSWVSFSRLYPCHDSLMETLEMTVPAHLNASKLASTKLEMIKGFG